MRTGINSAGRELFHRFRAYWPLGLVVLVAMAALSLFLVTRFQTATPVTAPLTLKTGGGMRVEKTLTMRDLRGSLVRNGIRPEGVFPSLTVFLASPTYFAVTGRQVPEVARQESSLLFYISESAHETLPTTVVKPLLRVDGGKAYEPVATFLRADSEHHRTAVLLYSAVGDDGQPLITEETGLLQLDLPDADGIVSLASGALRWQLPIEYANGLSSREVVLGLPEVMGSSGTSGVSYSYTGQAEDQPLIPVFGGPTLTWVAILAIMAGMLIALSPCLVQLAVYYTATLAGVSAEDGGTGRLDIAATRRHIIRTGLYFALGFTLIYTIGGAAAGFVGQSLNTLGLLSTWMRPLTVVAGVIIIFLALRVAWNARAPLICRLPMAPLFGRKHRTGALGSALMGITFAGGCMACFSATVLPALLLYAGSSGSIVYGALLLLVFSLGVSLPCLALAFGISRFQPLLRRLQRAGPLLGLTSAVVMAGFGVLMITYQFHIVSGFIGRFLEL